MTMMTSSLFTVLFCVSQRMLFIVGFGMAVSESTRLLVDAYSIVTPPVSTSRRSAYLPLNCGHNICRPTLCHQSIRGIDRTVRTALYSTTEERRSTAGTATASRKGSNAATLEYTEQQRTATDNNMDVDEEEGLSDVDARVLRSLLQDKKLALDTEEDVRKLLERGTVKKVSSPIPEESKSKESEKYSSQLLQTLADTKLWKKVSSQAAKVAESMSIWVYNKVEQDVKVLAALGLFAWDRAVRDVARALPATATTVTSNRKPWTLSDTSSYESMEDSRRVLEQMNRPVDEIQSVSREVFSILKGDRTVGGGGVKSATKLASGSQSGGAGRGLRTVAPAGNANAVERQRRALQQRQKLKQQAENVPGQILGSGTKLVDTAYEIQRELQVETNTPGYKTKPIRQAIAAGVTATTNVLRGVQEEARSLAAARQQQRLPTEKSSTTTTTTSVDTEGTDRSDATYDVRSATTSANPSEDWFISQDDGKAVQETTKEVPTVSLASLVVLLQAERHRVMQRLTQCIDDPAASWLTPAVIDTLPNDLDLFAGSGMQESLTKMIMLRDEIRHMEYSPNSAAMSNDTDSSASSSTLIDSVEELEDQLIMIRSAMEELCSGISRDVSDVIARQIRTEVFEKSGEKGPLSMSENDAENDTTNEVALILRVESVLAETMAALRAEENEIAKRASSKKKSTVVIPEVFDVIPDALFVDVIPDVFVMDTHSGIFGDRDINSVNGDGTMDATGAGLMAEIVTDDDFDNAVGAAKVAFTVSGKEEDDEAETEEDNVLVQATLRSLDVMFFIAERVLVAGVPGTVGTIQTAITRVEEVNRNGQGTVGWQPLGNVAKTKGRY